MRKNNIGFNLTGGYARRARLWMDRSGRPSNARRKLFLVLMYEQRGMIPMLVGIRPDKIHGSLKSSRQAGSEGVLDVRNALPITITYMHDLCCTTTAKFSYLYNPHPTSFSRKGLAEAEGMFHISSHGVVSTKYPHPAKKGADKDGRQKVSQHIFCPFNAGSTRRPPHFSFVHQPSRYVPKAIAAAGQYKRDSETKRGRIDLPALQRCHLQ